MSATVRDITTAIVQEIGKRDARIYELELLLDRDRTDTTALADALRRAAVALDAYSGGECEELDGIMALLARVEGATP